MAPTTVEHIAEEIQQILASLRERDTVSEGESGVAPTHLIPGESGGHTYTFHIVYRTHPSVGRQFGDTDVRKYT
jgi:hypothetical protein